LILFEAPHRIAATLKDLAQLFGAQRQAVVARELTKLHEAVYRGTLEQLAAVASSDPNFTRGEITLLIEGIHAAAETQGDRALLTRALKLLLPELPPARAAAVAAQIAGVRRSEAYALAQQLRAFAAVEGDP
jgi:16S rRNA (cytidine1402-2'-O)-methyltransferase